MTYEIFFAGVGATLLGTLVGALLAARLTEQFQKRLLDQQLEFQRKLHQESLAFQAEQGRLDAAVRKEISDGIRDSIMNLRDHLNAALDRLGDQARGH